MVGRWNVLWPVTVFELRVPKLLRAIQVGTAESSSGIVFGVANFAINCPHCITTFQYLDCESQFMIWRLHIVSQRILHPRQIAHARSMTVTTATNAPKSMKAKKRVPEPSPEPENPPADKAKPAKKKAKLPALPSTPVGTRYDVSMRPGKKPEKPLTIMSWNVAGTGAAACNLCLVALVAHSVGNAANVMPHGICRPEGAAEKGRRSN